MAGGTASPVRNTEPLELGFLLVRGPGMRAPALWGWEGPGSLTSPLLVVELPLDLQYLPPEKQREPDPDIRKMLLETILLVSAVRGTRPLMWPGGV